MKPRLILNITAIAGVVFLLTSPVFAAEASKAPDISFILEPAGYISVNGDSQKFRAHHWVDTDYQSGVKEFGYEGELGDDLALSLEGHALNSEHDYGTEAKLEKEGFGYILFEYRQFRKWYDSTGGVFYPFKVMPHLDTDKSLHMDIGEFSVEAALRNEKLPDMTLSYAREFREGTKSRLSWGSVTEGTVVAGGTPDALRKIAPSWMNVDEIVDKYKVGMEDDWFGYHWKADQNWEVVRAKNQRHEQNYSTTPNNADGTNSDQKIRDQFTEPRSDLIETVLGLDRWFSKDTVYVSSGYRFAQLKSRELENIYETDQNGNIRSFSNAEQVRDSYSDNLYTSHTWVENLHAFITKTFLANVKFKAETTRRVSASTYQKDLRNGSTAGTNTAPIIPDGTIDQIDKSEVQNKIMTYGESVSLRYSGIPRLALYNEYEFQQTRNNIYEDRQSSTANEIFNRQTIAHMYRTVGTLGARWSPWNPFVATVDLRHREDAMHFNNARVSGNDSARSIFMDGEFIDSNELSTKMSLKVADWFQPSFRYQAQYRKYETWGLSDSDNVQESDQISNIYTAEITTQPTDYFLATASFSYQEAKVLTPARLNTSRSLIPTFNSDVYTALLNAEFSVNEDLVLMGTAQYSKSANFDDYNYGIPYGVDFNETDVTFGCRWQCKKNVSVEPKVSYYRYDPNPSTEFSGYDAYAMITEVRVDWG